MTPFLSLAQLADLAGISDRAVEKAVTRSIREGAYLWRDARLAIRTTRGRGGRSGLRYEVRLDSLPIDLQRRFNEVYGPEAPRLSHGPKAQVERDFRYHVISPALAHPKNSTARGDAIREIAAREHFGPNNKPKRIPERTIQRYLEAYERNGDLGSLSRAKRSDAGSKLTIISRCWDRAVTLDDATKHRIAEALRHYIRGLHAAGESWGILCDLAAFKLRTLTGEAGCALGTEAEDICRVPAHMLQAERVYRRVALKQRDRKAYEDQRPRQRRSRDGMAPMEVLVGDVHPIDIVLRREDGSLAHARAIGWLDMATNRIWLDIVLLDKGKGITNAHVIQSFINVMNAWGAPRTLYLDNGSEYNWAAFTDDALRLLDTSGQRLIGTAGPRPDRPTLVRAKPYNAAAKPIEGIFAVLEQHYLHVIPGWIAGDRMKKKTSSVGGKVDPFPGTLHEFRAIVKMQLDLYHMRSQRKSGSLKGRSPNQVFQAAIDAGWTQTMVTADAIALAFSERIQKPVRQGSISHGGERWTCDQLAAWQEGKATVLVPRYQDWAVLPLLNGDGEIIGHAEREITYHSLDRRGAIDARTGERLHAQGVAALVRQAPKLDLLDERRRLVESAPAAPVASIGATIGPSEEARRILERMKETPKQRREREENESLDRTKGFLTTMGGFLKKAQGQR